MLFRTELTAIAGVGSHLVGFQGCDAVTGATCSLELASGTRESATITVTFALDDARTLSIVPSPNGRVTSTPAGIDCGTTCSVQFASGTPVTLAAVASAGFRFDEFVEAACRVSPIVLTSNLSCTPQFTSTQTAALNVTVVGGGTVTSTPAGIACPGDCDETYPIGTDVTLTPAASAGSAFSAWSGDADCEDGTVRMGASHACIATFVPSGWQQVGSALGGPVSFQRMSIAVDRSVASTPVLYAANAVSGAGGRVDLIVRRFDGASWTVVGTGPINQDATVSTRFFRPSIAVDGGGRPTVAWSENNQRIRVSQWDGASWVSLAENLNVDPNRPAIDTQLVTHGSQLVVAWLEPPAGSSSIVGRMAVKRFSPATQQWTGGLVLPAEPTMTGLRLTTEPTGNAVLMFVPLNNNMASGEDPVGVVREDALGNWTETSCGRFATPPPTPPNNFLVPNSEHGFGIARSSATAEPIAVVNNGEAVFAVVCRNGAWQGLDGSALGQVAIVGSGEVLRQVSVTRGEGEGFALSWSKATFTGAGGHAVQVLAENQTATGVVANQGPLLFDNGATSFGLNDGVTLAWWSADSPVLAGSAVFLGQYEARAYHFVP